MSLEGDLALKKSQNMQKVNMEVFHLAQILETMQEGAKSDNFGQKCGLYIPLHIFIYLG